MGFGANYALTVEASDLASFSATNTAIVFTNAVKAPYSLEFRGWKLDVPFDSETVTNAFSMTVSFGETNATTKWLSSVQVAYDATPTVKASFGTTYSGTASVTLTATTNLVATGFALLSSNIVYSGSDTNVLSTNSVVYGATTTTAYVVSAATGASTVTIATPLLADRTSNGALVTTLSEPGAERIPNTLTRGKMRIFLRIIGDSY